MQTNDSGHSEHLDESRRYKDRRQHAADRQALDTDQVRTDGDNRQAADSIHLEKSGTDLFIQQ
jgi:hypothetical protein